MAQGQLANVSVNLLDVIGHHGSERLLSRIFFLRSEPLVPLGGRLLLYSPSTPSYGPIMIGWGAWGEHHPQRNCGGSP